MAAPQITLPSIASIPEDAPTAIAGISISDADAALDPGGLYAVELWGGGAWTFAATSGVTRPGGSTLVGTLADLNAALATAVLTPHSNVVGTLHGGDGADYMVGGTDDDELYGGLGDDQFFGGAGTDLIVTGRVATRSSSSSATAGRPSRTSTSSTT